MLSSMVMGISKGFLLCLEKFALEGRELVGKFGTVDGRGLVGNFGGVHASIVEDSGAGQ